MRALPLVVLLAACPPPPVETDDSDTDTEADTDTDADSDTDADTDSDTDVGTDADRDGWTVEEGDCDDDDVFVNPAWEERANDDKDNDCDGRIDESMGGVYVFEVLTDLREASSLREVDGLGDIVATRSLGAAHVADVAVEVPGQGRWLVVESETGALLSVADTGATTPIWSFEGATELVWPREALGVWGLARARDGRAFLTTANTLVEVETGGASAIVADWPCQDEAEGSRICAVGLTAVATTDEIVLVGAFGGIARWTPSGGLVDVIVEDAGDPAGAWVAARSDEQGRIYLLGTYEVAGVATTGVFRVNLDTGALTLRGPWLDSEGRPPGGVAGWRLAGFDIDTVRDEYYVTANIGTNRRALYRVFDVGDGDDGYAALLWPATFAGTPPPGDEAREFRGVAVKWDQD